MAIYNGSILAYMGYNQQDGLWVCLEIGLFHSIHEDESSVRPISAFGYHHFPKKIAIFSPNHIVDETYPHDIPIPCLNSVIRVIYPIVFPLYPLKKEKTCY